VVLGSGSTGNQPENTRQHNPTQPPYESAVASSYQVRQDDDNSFPAAETLSDNFFHDSFCDVPAPQQQSPSQIDSSTINPSILSQTYVSSPQNNDPASESYSICPTSPGNAPSAAVRRGDNSPHICGQCGKGFPRRCDLTSHQRTHNKTHTCETCGRGFGTPKDLRRHRWEKHKQGRREMYRCNVKDCKKAGHKYDRKSNLRRHIETIHPRLQGRDLEEWILVEYDG